MNIIKLKDILMPETSNMAEFFNKNLKGKYAYWIQMRYIFPLEALDYKTYIKYEQYDAFNFLAADVLPHLDLYSEDCCMADFVNVYVDTTVTEEINNINKYSIANGYTSDDDLDISMLRRFRTWLAEELLKFNEPGLYTEGQLYMLDYYKNCMYNEVIKQLTLFNDNSISINGNNTTGCGCCSNNNSSIYSLGAIDVCNALSIYKENIHNAMVESFSDLDFWKNKNIDFLILFKKYIDNILKVKLTVVTINKNATAYTDCNCNKEQQSTNDDILARLSIALGYIINKDYAGHSNYIHDALYNWAEYLYDYMYWEINK
jgi:hypothetical protein